MVQRQLLKKRFTFMGELHQNIPAVIGGSQSAYETLFDEPVDEPDGAVMLQLHSFGQRANGGFDTVGQSSNGEEQLMLLRFDAGLPGRILAKTKKATNLITQFRHGLKVGLVRTSLHIVVRYYRDTMYNAMAYLANSFPPIGWQNATRVPRCLLLPDGGGVSLQLKS